MPAPVRRSKWRGAALLQLRETLDRIGGYFAAVDTSEDAVVRIG